MIPLLHLADFSGLAHLTPLSTWLAVHHAPMMIPVLRLNQAVST